MSRWYKQNPISIKNGYQTKIIEGNLVVLGIVGNGLPLLTQMLTPDEMQDFVNM